MFDTVIVRFGGEIGIKAPFTRKQYERRLNINIRASLKHHHVPYSTLSRIPGRLYIRTNQAEETAQKLAKVFGISSLSPAFTTTSDLDEILDASARLASKCFKQQESFAVRCHRVGKHPYTSQEICAKVGEHILSSLQKLDLTVNLTNPKRTLQLEIRDKQAYLFTDVIKGASGLPIGTQPKLVCLLKDDVQSAVACWMTMKRGCPQVLLNITENLSTSANENKRCEKIAKILMEWSIGFPTRLRTAHLNCSDEKALEKQGPELALMVRKRLILRIAQRVAEATRAEGTVTGDTFGKHPAHSIHCFRILDDAVNDLPIYRPLLGLDDKEITSDAQRIGYVNATAKKAQQPHAEAVINLDKIRKIEHELHSEKIIDDAIRSMQITELAP
jgi:thiamine biosynthesis protein ThiI